MSARIEELRKRLDKDPASRLFAQLAEELRKEGHLVEAIRVCRTGLEKHANYPSARMTLARCLFDSGDLSAARAELEGVVAAVPDNILAHRLLAESCEGLGELGAAARAYQVALRFSPGDKQLAAQAEAVAERARRAASAPARQPSSADLENRLVGPEDEPAPVPLAAAEEDFVIERSGEALDETLPPPPRAQTASAAGVPERALGGGEVVFEFATEDESSAPPASHQPVFRPLDEPSPATPAGSPLPATLPGVDAATVAGSALASPTLAEIYFGQGAYDQAIQTYEAVLRREPANDAARARLAEIGALVAEQALAAEAGGADGRRAVLLRTIARLEALMVAVGRK